MTSHRLTLNLGLVAVGIASACSLTVPSEDEVFGDAGSSSSTAGSSGANGGSGNAATGGDPQTDAGSGGTIAGGGNSMGGKGGSAGAGDEAGADAGGAGGAPEPPEPTGEVTNPGFEGTLLGWTVAPKTPGLWIQYSNASVTSVEGVSVLSGWYPKEGQEAFAARVFQVVKGLEDGTYRLSAQMMAKSGMPKAKLYAANCGGTDPEPASSIAEAWHEVAIEEVQVAGGECEIGFDIDSRIGDWVNIDIVAFEKVEPK